MTAALIPEGLEPVGVWDSAGPEFWADGAPRLPRVAWLNALARPRISTDRLRRIEFYLLDGPFAVTYRYVQTRDGMPVTGQSGKPAEEAAIVPLAELPPAHLLRQP